MRALLLSLLAVSVLPGCSRDDGFTVLRREMSTAFLTLDLGTTAVGDRETEDLYLASTGSADVTIYDIQVEDTEHWEISAGWATTDGDGDGVNDSLSIPGGTRENPSYEPLTIIFKPDAEGEYRTTLTITSDDNAIAETNEAGQGIWEVVLRGVGRYPCVLIYPDFHDFGSRPAGGYFSETSTIENCGQVKLTISDFDIVGDAAFSVATPTPFYVLPGSWETIDLAFVPSGGSPAEGATIELDSNASETISDILVIGNDCEQSVDSSWDADTDGWMSCGGDCDDADGTVNPSVAEVTGNGRDDDCDGEEDEDDSLETDSDGDGFSTEDGDCYDEDENVNPHGVESLNQIDDDCDGEIDEGTEWSDDDTDGYPEPPGDCDDAEPNVGPGLSDEVNQIDDDCDGFIDESSDSFDDDGDGFAEEEGASAGGDCDDSNPWAHPGGVEDCDSRDNDCDGIIDEGADGVADSACARLLERAPPEDADDVKVKKGCSQVPATGGLLLLVLGALGTAASRRRR